MGDALLGGAGDMFFVVLRCFVRFDFQLPSRNIEEPFSCVSLANHKISVLILWIIV